MEEKTEEKEERARPGRQRYYRPSPSGTTAPATLPEPRESEEMRRQVRARAVLPPPGERYYRQSGAVLPALRDGFEPELPPVVSLRPNYYK